MAQMPKWLKTVFIAALFFAAGLFIGQDWHPGFFLNEWYPGYFIAKLVSPSSECVNKYPLTSRSLDCITYNDGQERLKDVDNLIDTATAQYIKEGKATNISVWVRDLESRQTASNNENVRYDPASLLKLPLMIAYFKVAEIEPSILDTQLPYTKSLELSNDAQDIPSQTTFVEGLSYTVAQHIENMIINSDNNSASVLQTHIDQTIFQNTLLDLGIKILASDNTGTRDLMTAKTYATIFRTLYNASYLDREYSEKALEIMSKITYKGIAQPLPASVQVAHKFGEREVDAMDGTPQTRELHDCGIVYKDDTPYSFCIMTQGKSFADLQTVIENMSKLVYDKI